MDIHSGALLSGSRIAFDNVSDGLRVQLLALRGSSFVRTGECSPGSHTRNFLLQPLCRMSDRSVFTPWARSRCVFADEFLRPLQHPSTWSLSGRALARTTLSPCLFNHSRTILVSLVPSFPEPQCALTVAVPPRSSCRRPY